MTATSPTLRRFIEALQVAIAHGTDRGDTITELGLQNAVARLHRVAPIARSIVLLGNPLAGVRHNPMDAFVESEEARAENPDPDPTDDDVYVEVAKAAACFAMGLCVGLLIADVV